MPFGFFCSGEFTQLFGAGNGSDAAFLEGFDENIPERVFCFTILLQLSILSVSISVSVPFRMRGHLEFFRDSTAKTDRKGRQR